MIKIASSTITRSSRSGFAQLFNPNPICRLSPNLAPLRRPAGCLGGSGLWSATSQCPGSIGADLLRQLALRSGGGDAVGPRQPGLSSRLLQTGAKGFLPRCSPTS